jgi:hypothetical protein
MSSVVLVRMVAGSPRSRPRAEIWFSAVGSEGPKGWGAGTLAGLGVGRALDLDGAVADRPSAGAEPRDRGGSWATGTVAVAGRTVFED